MAETEDKEKKLTSEKIAVERSQHNMFTHPWGAEVGRMHKIFQE